MFFKKDDGIKFQWGEKYIKAGQIIKNVGGKYWRQNSDGTITEFSPPDLRFQTIVTIIKQLFGQKINIDIDNKNYTITFKSESENFLTQAYEHFNDRYFWQVRGVTVKLDSKTLFFNISNDIKECTYMPDQGPKN